MEETKRDELRLSALAKYAWAVVVYALAVIAWGAFVRASGSGAGCGEHWPLCNGEVVPRTKQMQTLIELAHRVTSGLSLILIIGLFIWTYRATPKRHPSRVGAMLSILFIITEALVGAGLVLFGLVAKDESISRAIVMSIHLTNTLLLLAALGLTAWWASGADATSLRERFRRGRAFPSQNLLTVLLVLTLIGTLILGISGAVSALGATLFPVTSLREGWQQDLSPTAHLFVRLRIFHPFIATLNSVFLGLVAGLVLAARKHVWTRRAASLLIILVIAEFTAGVINLLLHAPIWLQLLHLILADLMWLALVLLAASVLLPASSAIEDVEDHGLEVGKDLALSSNV